MKHLVRVILVIIVSTLGASIYQGIIPSVVSQTIFTVIGILFSVGYSVILGFDTTSIPNTVYANGVNKKLKTLSKEATFYFIITCACFIMVQVWSWEFVIWRQVCFSTDMLIVTWLAFVVLNFALSFKRLFEIKIDIFQELRKLKD